MRDERICLAAEIKKKEEREDRERGQWEGGETDDPALWDSGLCLGGGGQSVSACRTSPDTDGRDAVSCSVSVRVCVCVCSCGETRPTSDPTHTLPSAAQESAFCSLWTEPLQEDMNVCERAAEG